VNAIPNYAIEVYLDNGQTLRTEDTFDSEDEAYESIVDQIEDRESPWKGIGHLAIHFRSIVGFSIEAIQAPKLRAVE